MLKIGCSSGFYVFILSQRFPKFNYTGVDFSLEFIAFGKSSFCDLDLEVQDAIQLNFPSEHFGIVVSGCLLLHLDDWRLGIKEIGGFKEVKKFSVDGNYKTSRKSNRPRQITYVFAKSCA